MILYKNFLERFVVVILIYNSNQFGTMKLYYNLVIWYFQYIEQIRFRQGEPFLLRHVENCDYLVVFGFRLGKRNQKIVDNWKVSKQSCDWTDPDHLNSTWTLSRFLVLFLLICASQLFYYSNDLHVRSLLIGLTCRKSSPGGPLKGLQISKSTRKFSFSYEMRTS